MTPTPDPSRDTARAPSLPTVVVLMGVSGAGKTTVGERLAESLGWRFADADAFHPESNVERMRRGEGLTDEHRWPWLAALRAHVRDAVARGEPLVLACSALRRAYRDALVPPEAASEVCVVFLRVSRAELERRLAARVGHFMPPTLLDSQLATLEPPAADEPGVVTVDAEGDVDAIVAAVRDAISDLRWGPPHLHPNTYGPPRRTDPTR